MSKLKAVLPALASKCYKLSYLPDIKAVEAGYLFISQGIQQ
jgi:hypothetical protein